MKTVVFAATKGGVGKTTLCYSVAIEAAKRHQVLIADLDPQRSLKQIWGRRQELLNPRLVSNVANLAQSIKLLTEAGYDREFLFVDTPGSGTPVIRDAIAAADIVVLPVQPSPMDWHAQEAVADLVDSMGMGDRALFVVSRAEGKSDMVDRTRQFFELRTRFPILKVTQRADFARAVETGRSGAELNKDAGKDIRELWAAIQKALANVATKSKHAEDKSDDHKQLH
jgi:chromosome partitioning protein